jgi:hypothetical protein
MATDVNEQNPANTPNDGGATAEEKIQFTDAQQAYIQTLIDRAVGKAGAPYKKKAEKADVLEQKVTDLSNELEDARKLLKLAKSPADKEEAKESITNLQNELEEVRKAQKNVLSENDNLKKLVLDKEKLVEETNKRMIETRRENRIKLAMRDIPFIDKELVEEWTKKFIQYDPDIDDFYVVSDKGTTPRLNASMQPMTPEEYYHQLAHEKKHWVDGELKFGVGSGESNRSGFGGRKYTVAEVFKNPGSAKLAMKLKLENRAEYDRVRELAVADGTLAR